MWNIHFTNLSHAVSYGCFIVGQVKWLFFPPLNKARDLNGTRLCPDLLWTHSDSLMDFMEDLRCYVLPTNVRQLVFVTSNTACPTCLSHSANSEWPRLMILGTETANGRLFRWPCYNIKGDCEDKIKPVKLQVANSNSCRYYYKNIDQSVVYALQSYSSC